jgi:hypothetical protein
VVTRTKGSECPPLVFDYHGSFLQMRIPVKPATHSGGKRPLSERSDAGLLMIIFLVAGLSQSGMLLES